MIRLHPSTWFDLETYDKGNDTIIVLKDFNFKYVFSEFKTKQEIFFYELFYKFDIESLIKIKKILDRVINELTREVRLDEIL